MSTGKSNSQNIENSFDCQAGNGELFDLEQNSKVENAVRLFI
jgi:hypothetical protein